MENVEEKESEGSALEESVEEVASIQVEQVNILEQLEQISELNSAEINAGEKKREVKEEKSLSESYIDVSKLDGSKRKLTPSNTMGAELLPAEVQKTDVGDIEKIPGEENTKFYQRFNQIFIEEILAEIIDQL